MKRKYSCILSLIIAVLLAVTAFSSCSLDIFLDNTFDMNSVFEQNRDGLRVHFLDVGQGDSIFIELPNGETMLIDAGENYNGEGIINYIEDCGEDKIDYLVATHPHADHIGSMAYIVRNFEIGSVYMPKVSTNTKTYENLLTSISKKGLKVKSAKAGMNITSDGDLSADILAPVTIDSGNLNNCSVVVRLVYGDASFLFLGDAEKAEIDSVTLDMSADVLKVGHHGSNTSTTPWLLERVNPEIAVISCGRDNSYGHPHEETLEYLNSFGCEVYRTDTDKTVIIDVTPDMELDITTDVRSIKKAK